LPDYVYFNHGIHVAKGVKCATCHGRIDEMPLTWRVNALRMDWCLNCHRHPDQFIGPRDEVFAMTPTPPKNAAATTGSALVRQYGIDSAVKLTNCSICHR
jgi:hypothetical protein